MVFAYYDSLSRADQAVYRASDKVAVIPLPLSDVDAGLIPRIEAQLAAGNREALRRACHQLVNQICVALQVPRVKLKVLSSRPHDGESELHGMYYPGEGRRRAELTLWMRTAKRRQLVAFRTFFRTLLHELTHHLDYELLELEDSFHTEGFYKRETALYRQLMYLANLRPDK